AWLTPHHAPVMTVPRMTAEFGGLHASDAEFKIIGDADDPRTILQAVLRGFDLPARPRIALSDRAHAETVVHLQNLLPDAQFISATDILRELRVIKTEDDIAHMRQAGAITEAAFSDVLAQLKIGMTELDIVAEVDYQMRRHGGLGPTFTTTLYNSGPNHPLILGQPLKTYPRVI